jgi:hypothetical protein
VIDIRRYWQRQRLTDRVLLYIALLGTLAMLAWAIERVM